jgi:two-component system chemotaxis sensor kinase CheA
MPMDMEQDELREILEEFFTEAEEGLDRLEQDLIKLEAIVESGEPGGDTVDRLFRVLHTLKGGAGFLGMERMAKLAHAGENLLDEVRSGHVTVAKPVMDALLQTNDLLKELLALSKAGDDPNSVEISALVANLEVLATGGSAPKATAPAKPAAPKAPAAPAAPAPTVQINADLLAEVMGDPSLDPSRDTGDDDAPVAKPAPAVAINADLLAEVMGDPSLDPSRDTGDDAAPVAKPAPAVAINAELLAEVMGDSSLDPSRDKGDDDAPAKPAAVPAKAADEPAIERGTAEPFERREDSDRRQGNDDRRKGPRRDVDPQETTIRVETGRLDQVMNLVGELVLARNSLLRQFSMQEAQDALAHLPNSAQIVTNIELLSRVTRDLQSSVLRTRMQPIKKVFDKIPRQVRELKTKLGKEVDLILEGEMTEVDKSLVEELSDPMVHLIRNALDHGLEPPEERLAAGKSPTGTLTVRAFYEGNNVVIQIAEDGRGINPEKIKAAAIKKGVIDAETAATMSDRDAIRLIFEPGFSTAEKISDVSGRGVGMDVVNSKIAAVKGTIDISSEVGFGTTISIFLPLTLAIVQALIVKVQTEGFAIPISTISEVLKFNAKDVHRINEQDVIELRGQVLPIYYLSQLAHEHPGAESATSRDGYVIVVRNGKLNIGVVVDTLVGQEEAVVKSISNVFEYNKAVSGATISGDGSVHMILDVPLLMKQLHKGSTPSLT